jgi:hemerythrin-like domain-containing protein
LVLREGSLHGIDRPREELKMVATEITPQAVWAFAEHEHRDLDRGLNRIHDVACEVNSWVPLELSTHLLGILDWVQHALEPHIAWEETWLYPELDLRAGTQWTTRSARFDHQQIRDMVARIRDDQHGLREQGARDRLPEVRCHLFSLEALIRAHVEREERFLIPLLDEEFVSPKATPETSQGPMT